MRLTFLLLFCLSQITISAQSNEIKARIEYEDAEKYFSESKYTEAITHLENAQRLIGNWNHKIGYLRILCYDATTDYSEWNSTLESIEKEVIAYMNYADKNANKIDSDKFREIFTIDKKVELIKKKKTWLETKDFKDALSAYENKNYTQALQLFKKEADKGNGRAMHWMGYFYESGLGIDKNYADAIIWYKKANENDINDCIENIGNLYFSGGYGVTENRAEAISWYKKGAEKNVIVAYTNLGLIYMEGLGVEKDYPEALKWLTAAAEKGNTEAMAKLCEVYCNPDIPKFNDYKLAKYWCEKAANKNNSLGLTGLASLYFFGWGVTEDYQMGIYYTRKAGEYAETKEDKFGVGSFFYDIGYYEDTIKFIEQAIQLGYEMGENRILADAYYREGNYPKALEAFQIAYKNGNKSVVTEISEIYRQGLGVPKNKDLAREWKKKE